MTEPTSITALQQRITDLEALTKTQAEMLTDGFNDMNSQMQIMVRHMRQEIKREILAELGAADGR